MLHAINSLVGMADQGGGHVLSVIRDYRKGNWTVSETMVLIEAKKMDDERRMKRTSDSEGRSKPAELRWKWVEDYCWRKGCLRSQNQCNDKWDNLMRDYKKVRDYERRIAERGDGSEESYWKLEKNERKGKNLPNNMLLQIYEALVDVVDRRGGQRIMTIGGNGGGGGSRGGGSSSNHNIGYMQVDRPVVSVQPSTQPHQAVPVQLPVLPPPAPPPPPHPQVQAEPPHSAIPSDSDTSEYSDSPAKRRRRRGGGGGEGTSGGTASASTSHEVGTAISKSASIIAETIQACEEREARRHRELLSIHERRLKIEESKTEINREGINGLVEAINNLANSILAFASHKNDPDAAPK